MQSRLRVSFVVALSLVVVVLVQWVWLPISTLQSLRKDGVNSNHIQTNWIHHQLATALFSDLLTVDLIFFFLQYL